MVGKDILHICQDLMGKFLSLDFTFWEVVSPKLFNQYPKDTLKEGLEEGRVER